MSLQADYRPPRHCRRCMARCWDAESDLILLHRSLPSLHRAPYLCSHVSSCVGHAHTCANYSPPGQREAPLVFDGPISPENPHPAWSRQLVGGRVRRGAGQRGFATDSESSRTPHRSRQRPPNRWRRLGAGERDVVDAVWVCGKSTTW